MGAYSILFDSSAAQALARMPLPIRGEIRRRLSELALAADAPAAPAAADVPGTLRFEVAGHVVSYVVSDARRTLTVMSVAPT